MQQIQPRCSPLPLLSPLGPLPSLSGSQGSSNCSSNGDLQQLEEKLLFEKFWKGTSKAVATPRPESIIVASITSRRRPSDLEAVAGQPLQTDEVKRAAAVATVAATKVDTIISTCCHRRKRRKHHSHRRARSPSSQEEPSPRPKTKKKKRKSERKRKRKRSPSRSLSPPRRKKKKKKKNSKKSKRHRNSSRKSKHSSLRLKRKRKDERKHKKRSRTHSRRRRHHCLRTASESSSEDRQRLHKSVVHRALGGLAAAAVVVQEATVTLDAGDMKWRPATKSLCSTAAKYRSILSTATEEFLIGVIAAQQSTLRKRLQAASKSSRTFARLRLRE